MNPEAVKSKEEALNIHEAKNSIKINRGREIAHELCQKNGSTHSREVRTQLVNEGIHKPSENESETWLGAIFGRNGYKFKKTGEEFIVNDEERNIHARAISVWKLNAD